MPLSAGTVAAALTLETKGFQTGLDKARSLIKTLQSDSMTAAEKVRALGTTMQGLGKTLTLSVTSSVIGLGATAVKTFTGFDDAMRQVRATMNATAEDTEALTQAAKDAGATTRYSAAEAAAALNYLALAGYDSKTAIAALPDVLRLAQAGGMDLAYTSDLLTDSMSALGKSPEYMQTFADQMTRASQRSNTSIAQLGEGILTVGGLAKNLAGDTVELNTVLGILADNGIKGAEGGTHLRNAILALTAPEKQGAEALKALGVSASDSEGKLRPLKDVFADLNRAMAGMTDTERTQTIADIFRTTDIASVNALLATSAERWDELGAAIDNSSGAAQSAAETMEGGIGGAFRSLKSAVEGAAIEFGENLAPMVQSAAEWVTGLARSFSGLSESTQNMILRVAAFAAAAGPALIVMGKLVTAAGTLMKVFSGPAGWVMLGVGAVGALVVAMNNARKEMDGFSKGFKTVMDGVDQEKVDSITAGIEVGFSFTGKDGNSVTEQFRAQLPTVYDSISTALTDGKEDDAQTVEQLEGQVRDYYAGQISLVEQWANDEIAKLDVNSATYDSEVANIQAKAAELTGTLRGLQGETLDWISANAGRATATVQTHLGELDAIQQRALEVLATIDEVTSAEANLYETRVDLAKRGVDTSEENVGIALGWERGKYEQAVAEAQAAAQEEREQLLAQVAAGELSDAGYAMRKEALDEVEQADLARAAEAYRTSMGEIFAGVMQGSGEGAPDPEEFAKAAAILELKNYATLVGNGGMTMKDVQEQISPALASLLSDNGYDITKANEMLGNGAPGLNAMYTYLAKNTAIPDWSAIAPYYKSALGAGIFEGVFDDIDLSSEQGQMQALFSLLGAAAPEAVAQGIEEGTPEVERAAEDMADAATDAVQGKTGGGTMRATGEAARRHYEGEALAGAEELTEAQLDKLLRDAMEEAGRLMTEESFPGTDGKDIARKMSATLKRALLVTEGFNVDDFISAGSSESGGVDLFNKLFNMQYDAQSLLDGIDQEEMGRQAQEMFRLPGEASADGFAAGVTDGTGDVEDANREMAEAGEEALEGALGIASPSRVYRQIGEFAVEGLILGLEDRRAELLAAARSLAEETAQTVREALDIHSPSRVFRSLGRNTAEGFALGIDDGMFRAQDSLSRLTEGRTGSRSGGMTTVQAAPTINITLPNAVIRSEKDIHDMAGSLAGYIGKVQRGYGG